mgnify:FL=1
MENLRIAIGSDHGGYEYKEQIVSHLKEKGYECVDVGTYSTDSCDYPVIARAVTTKITTGDADRGILICGTGIGMSIVANKVKGIRAALCGDTFSARASRAHNNSNVLCLGERVIGINLAMDIVDIWLESKFEGGRHQRRVDMMEN